MHEYVLGAISMFLFLSLVGTVFALSVVLNKLHTETTAHLVTAKDLAAHKAKHAEELAAIKRPFIIQMTDELIVKFAAMVMGGIETLDESKNGYKQ